MDKLEEYLDRVCRGIGGPKSMRQHVRQELREHLRDAIAEHRTAGMSEELALARALDDFGGPDDVRSELQETHGQRLMPVVIDKAIEWKEKTMRAKWLWTTWAYLAVAGIVAVDILFFAFSQMMFLPKLKKLGSDGAFRDDIFKEPILEWLNTSLRGLEWVAGHATWILLIAIGAWGLFEWRSRNENKPFVRLAILGSSAFGLTLWAVVIAAAMVIPLLLAMPGRMAR